MNFIQSTKGTKRPLPWMKRNFIQSTKRPLSPIPYLEISPGKQGQKRIVKVPKHRCAGKCIRFLQDAGLSPVVDIGNPENNGDVQVPYLDSASKEKPSNANKTNDKERDPKLVVKLESGPSLVSEVSEENGSVNEREQHVTWELPHIWYGKSMYLKGEPKKIRFLKNMNKEEFYRYICSITDKIGENDDEDSPQVFCLDHNHVCQPRDLGIPENDGDMQVPYLASTSKEKPSNANKTNDKERDPTPVVKLESGPLVSVKLESGLFPVSVKLESGLSPVSVKLQSGPSLVSIKEESVSEEEGSVKLESGPSLFFIKEENVSEEEGSVRQSRQNATLILEDGQHIEVKKKSAKRGKRKRKRKSSNWGNRKRKSAKRGKGP